MTEPKPPKKRVVTKRKYVRYLFEKTWLVLSSFVLAGLGVLILGWVVKWIGQHFSQLISWRGPVAFAQLVAFCLIARRLLRNASKRVKELGQIESVEPLTRNNTGHLPVEETLVRASTEPTTDQEKVLLRAATRGEETPPEQLLRAGNLPN
jgi:hypothetical protein